MIADKDTISANSTRAAQLWHIPEVRSLIFEYMSAVQRLRLATLDQATFRTFVQAALHEIHIDKYLNLPLAHMPQVRDVQHGNHYDCLSHIA